MLAAPRAEVIDKLADTRHDSACLESLLSLAMLEGEPGMVGTKARLVHKVGSVRSPVSWSVPGMSLS